MNTDSYYETPSFLPNFEVLTWSPVTGRYRKVHTVYSVATTDSALKLIPSSLVKHNEEVLLRNTENGDIFKYTVSFPPAFPVYKRTN